MTTPTVTRTRGERAEGVVQVVILLAIASMAGAASFTHMHDWTMDNSPAGTGEWFGWANAVISELTPLAAGLEARRRRRNGLPVGYPVAVLVAFAGLSLAAQFSQASASISGWLLAGLPAVAFLVLVKLVLAGPARPVSTPDSTAMPVEPVDADPVPVVQSVPVAPSPARVRPVAVVPVPAEAFSRVNGFTVHTGPATSTSGGDR